MKTGRLIKCCAVFLLTIGIASCQDNKKNKSVPEVKVRVMTISIDDDSEQRQYMGTIEALKHAELSFTSAGTITKINVKEGTRVHQGQFIAEMNSTVAKSEFLSAKSQYNHAEDAFGRCQKMYYERSLPEAQWVEARETLHQAESQLLAAKKQLSDCRIIAPFTGIITLRNAEPGQNIDAGATVVSLVNINSVKACFNVSSSDIDKFNIGDKLRISVTERDNRTFNAVISEKSIQADEATHTYTVKATMPNTAGILLPGMIVKIHSLKHTVSSKHDIVIPENIILLETSNRRFVWTVKNGRAHRSYVTIGDATSQGVVIKSGLQQGDFLIEEGQQKVSENSKVTTL